jgi:hypothetical protein
MADLGARVALWDLQLPSGVGVAGAAPQCQPGSQQVQPIGVEIHRFQPDLLPLDRSPGRHKCRRFCDLPTVRDVELEFPLALIRRG